MKLKLDIRKTDIVYADKKLYQFGDNNNTIKVISNNNSHTITRNLINLLGDSLGLKEDEKNVWHLINTNNDKSIANNKLKYCAVYEKSASTFDRCIRKLKEAGVIVILNNSAIKILKEYDIAKVINNDVDYIIIEVCKDKNTKV